MKNSLHGNNARQVYVLLHIIAVFIDGHKMETTGAFFPTTPDDARSICIIVWIKWREGLRRWIREIEQTDSLEQFGILGI